MAVGYVMVFPGASQADYDSVQQKLGLDAAGAQWPEGLVSHAAGPSETGAWCVIDIWDSAEAFESFYEGRLSQALQGTAMEGAQPRQFEVYDLHIAGQHAQSLRRAA